LNNENNISIVIEDEHKDSIEDIHHSRVSEIVINENEVLDTKNIISLTTNPDGI